ncbi:MAG: carboxypeptidase-like regulatory domain-containing protein [Myxococcaceae bacterium]|nr:carboxypeptidase-like regulatory domain-containing protein [Myxococcaceae bacterium]
MFRRMLVSCLLAFPAAAQETKNETVLITVRGTLNSDGKPVTAAQFYLSPADSRTAVELTPGGQFTVKGVASRIYSVSINATGYAPVERTIEIDARGTANLGNVKLDTLKTAKMSVVVAPREGFKGVAAQKVDLRHRGCANVRAQDESGCRLEFCVNQAGPNMTVHSYSNHGHLRPLGKMTLADAVEGLPKGTYVTGDESTVTLQSGDVWLFDGSDPYCGAVLRVDDLN